jgi:hypothetical protein
MAEASAATAISVEDLHMAYGPIVPIDQLPEWLQQIGRVSPLFHLAERLQTCLGVTSGTGLGGNNVAVLALWAIGSAIVAARAFKWEPRTARG